MTKLGRKEDNKAELIFDRWKSELKEMDRSRANVYNNFELLFVTLDDSKISFEVAHQILSKAIIAHYPSKSVVDNVYRRLKPVLHGKNKQEFEEEWKENISASAKRAFYGLYNIDGAADQEDKKFGSMSASEYKKQRKYAESYPVLDWQSISIEPITEDDLDINLADLEEDNE
jgi:hypothetical protein